jgi:hypothetical protein
MRLKGETFSWFRVMVLLWVSLWMLAVPLFHVHPEADHRHGETGHVHGGTVHTVWSPDLDCEFANHESHEEAVSAPALFAHSGEGHTEFGLSLLTDSTDRKSLKPFLIQVLGFSTDVVSVVEQSAWIRRSITAVPSSLPFIRTVASRGPPNLFA